MAPITTIKTILAVEDVYINDYRAIANNLDNNKH